MKLNKLLLILILALSSSYAFPQSSSALKKKKQALEREISLLQKNAARAANNKKLTLSQINALNAQIGLMQNKISVINSEIRNLDSEIHENNHTVQTLTGQLGQLKMEYAAMIRFAQRNKNAYEKMMFIFASSDFNQAFKRLKYLQQFSQYRKKQADYMQGKQKDLRYKIVILDKNLKEKSSLMQEQEEEKDKLGKSKTEQSKALDQYSKQEKQFKQDIALRKKKQVQLDRDIRAAIARDIALAKKKAEMEERAALAAARAKAEKAAKAAAAARIAASKTPAAKTGAKTTAKPVPAPAVTPPSTTVYTDAAAKTTKLSAGFERNRGSLPWPVNGSITERFGKHMQGQASYINDGINIQTAAGATVRAIFEGKVSAVRSQLGRYFILIKHGEYYTVYQNLSTVSVAAGDMVTTRQSIGTVADAEGTPQLQFQIRRGMVAQNPEAWISK